MNDTVSKEKTNTVPPETANQNNLPQGAADTANAGQTPSAAGNADINAIIKQAEAKANEVAEKKVAGVFRDMLKQSGLDTDAINKITAEWKAKQTPPTDDEAVKAAQSEVEQLRREFDDYKVKIEAERKEREFAASLTETLLKAGFYEDRIGVLLKEADSNKTALENAADFAAKFPWAVKQTATAPYKPAESAGKTDVVYTAEQIKAMSPSEINKNWAKVKESLEKTKG
jgi:hypothetical protein